MSQALFSKFRFLDLYAFLPSLSFGKEGKVYSRFGFLLTLITVLIIGSMTVFLSLQVFGRQKPFVVQYQLPAQSLRPRMPFNTDTFPIALSTQSNAIFDDSARAFGVWGQLASPGYGVNLTVSSCQQNVDPGRDYFCFSQPEETKDQTYIDNGMERFFEVFFFQCDLSNGTNCLSPDDMKTFLTDTSYYFLYDDWIIDPTDYDNPVKPTKRFYEDYLLPNDRKVLLVNLEEVEFTSDNGWLFEDLKTETKLRASLTVQVTGRSATDSTIFTTKIQYSGNKTIYKRTYPKIQDLLAQIGGFITIIIPIFFIFVAPYADLRSVQYLVNEICEIQLNRTQENLNRKLSKSRNRSSKSLKYLATQTTQRNPTLNFDTKADILASHRARRTFKTLRTEPELQPKPSIELAQSLHIKVFETLDKENIDKNDLDSFEILEENILTPRPPDSILKSPSNPLKGSGLLSPKSVESRGEETEPTDGMLTSKKLLEGTVAEKLRTLMKEKEEGRQEVEIKIESLEQPENENEQEEEPEVENIIPLRLSDKIEINWSDWFLSLFKSQPKVQIIKEAKEHILGTLDLVTLSKKVVEIDKLKACLLTHDQRVIFENLPSSVIAYDSDIKKAKDAIRQYHWKESFKGDEKALKEAYLRIVGSESQRKLDKRLIKLYESEYLEDNEDAMVRKNTIKAKN